MSQDPTQQFLRSLPEIRPGERFWFACHPQVPCFNACCADLTMPLTPYDVLRLCRGLEMSSEAFIEEYTVPGCYEDSGFPLLHLRMEDAPGRPCPFLTGQGCGVYAHRSSACRTYPLGRATRPNPPAATGGEEGIAASPGARQSGCPSPQSSAPSVCSCTESGGLVPETAPPSGSSLDKGIREHYFLVREDHCRGFAENREWTIDGWLADQGIETYNAMNDRYMSLIARYKQAAAGALLSSKQATMALLCLYQQDRFLDFARSVNLFSRIRFLPDAPEGDAEQRLQQVLEDPEARLRFAFDWVELLLLGSCASLEPVD